MHFEPASSAAQRVEADDITGHGADALDTDAALELKRLQAAIHEIAALADQTHRAQSAAVTLAWLRRLTREVDRLQACWHGSLRVLPAPPSADPPPRRRRDETELSTPRPL